MEVNQERIEKAVIAEVSEMIIDQDKLRDHVKKAIDERINKLFKKSADAQITTAINEAIRDGFRRSYQKVDSWGSAIGETTTIKAELERIIAGYWNARVDSNGKPTDSSYNSMSRAEHTMLGLVAKDFSENMKQNIVDLGAQLKDGLRKELHGATNRLLSQVFHVRSWDDQGLKNPGRSCIDPPETAVKS